MKTGNLLINLRKRVEKMNFPLQTVTKQSAALQMEYPTQ
jgi:hypothetical protein